MENTLILFRINSLKSSEVYERYQCLKVEGHL